MAIMDDMQDNTNDQMARYQELMSKDRIGELDDKGREELAELRTKFE